MPPPEIWVVPGWGTSWYTRGRSYWLRRAGISLGLLACIGVTGGFLALVVAGAFSSASGRNVPGLVFLAILTVTTVVGFVWMWRRYERKVDSRQLVKETREAIFLLDGLLAFKWIALVVIIVAVVVGGVVSRQLMGIVAGLVALLFVGGAAFVFGPLLALFVLTLVAEPKPVREAREELDELYRANGIDPARGIDPETRAALNELMQKD